MDNLYDTRHLLSHKNGLLSDVASELAEIPTERVKELIGLGAIYVNHVRIDSDVEVKPETYFRIHLQPQRYVVDHVNWQEAIVFQNEHMVVVNKPRGMPVHAMVDNKIENVIHQLSQFMNIPLHVTQRLDVLTQGYFVLAKTKEFQKIYNGLLQEKKVHKVYGAFVERPVPIGLLKHFMKETNRSPKTTAKEVPPGEEALWKECLLKILSCDAHGEDFKIEIELITGRTHQIRAQLREAGAPLIGDKPYGSLRNEKEFRLVSQRLNFVCPLTREHFTFA